MSAIIPIPKIDLNIRLATLADIPFIDALQKKCSKELGFMYLQTLEGKIKAGDVLIAEVGANAVGYLIGTDRYFKRDDVGIIYQMNIAEAYRRSFVAAALLKAQFDRSAYGCRLYCCWCAKDLAANKFWEAMGFVPLAFRAGATLRRRSGQEKSRVHIFWQKRIRPDDQSTPWWYPAKTDSGAMGDDRLVFPIPPGVKWEEVEAVATANANVETPKALPDATENRRQREKKPKATIQQKPQLRRPGGLWVATAPVVPQEMKQVVVEKPKKERRKKVKIDPALVAKGRELRDRYLEQINGGAYVLASAGKYDLTRGIETTVSPHPALSRGEREIPCDSVKRLAA